MRTYNGSNNYFNAQILFCLTKINKCPFNFEPEVRQRIHIIPYAAYVRYIACEMYDYIALLSKYSYHLLYIFDYITLFDLI